MGFGMGGNTFGKILDPAGLFDEGGMFGKQKGIDTSVQDAFIRQLMGQSETLFNQSQPIRQQQLGMFGDVMSGKFDPTTSPMYASIFSNAKNATEDQYNLARENVIGGTARGGAQTGALGNLEMARAGTMSSLPAQISQGIIQDLMGKAYGSVFPQSGDSAAQTAMGGLNQMTNVQLQQALMKQQQNSSNMQGLGSLIALFA